MAVSGNPGCSWVPASVGAASRSLGAGVGGGGGGGGGLFFRVAWHNRPAVAWQGLKAGVWKQQPAVISPKDGPVSW